MLLQDFILQNISGSNNGVNCIFGSDLGPLLSASATLYELGKSSNGLVARKGAPLSAFAVLREKRFYARRSLADWMISASGTGHVSQRIYSPKIYSLRCVG